MPNVGLRFRFTDSLTLRTVARRVRLGEIPSAASLFDKAANAAETGEPLIVRCDSPEEAIAMADGFTLYGIDRPAIEALSGAG